MSKNQQLREWRDRLKIGRPEVVRDNIGVYTSTLRRIESGEINMQYPSELIANVVKTVETYYRKREKLKGVK